MAYVIDKLPLGGSGRGISHYLDVAACARRAHLKTQDSDERDGPPPNTGATIGVIFHAIMEGYYDGIPLSSIQLALDEKYDEDAKEAWRLAVEYARRFGPQDFEVLHLELLFPEEDDLVQAARIRQLFGVELTARLDMVVRIGEEHIEPLLQKRPGLAGIVPGVYLWDFKTSYARDAHAALKWRMSPQFIAYPMMWDLLQPDTPCLGMVADVVIRHRKFKPESFESYLVRPPVEVQREGLIKWLGRVQKMEAARMPNWVSCFNWGPCRFYTDGICDRV